MKTDIGSVSLLDGKMEDLKSYCEHKYPCRTTSAGKLPKKNCRMIHVRSKAHLPSLTTFQGLVVAYALHLLSNRRRRVLQKEQVLSWATKTGNLVNPEVESGRYPYQYESMAVTSDTDHPACPAIINSHFLEQQLMNLFPLTIYIVVH